MILLAATSCCIVYNIQALTFKATDEPIMYKRNRVHHVYLACETFYFLRHN